jgi:hypothetical protein
MLLLVGKKQGGHRKLGYDKSRTQERPKGHPKEFALARKQIKKDDNSKRPKRRFKKLDMLM